MSNKQRYSRAQLLRKIQELSFVKVEIELYLDTHPDSIVAMEHYREATEALDAYMAEFSAAYSPITAREGIMNDRWAWVDKPWPWQKNDTDTEDKE